jgi:hypothetical protein
MSFYIENEMNKQRWQKWKPFIANSVILSLKENGKPRHMLG